MELRGRALRAEPISAGTLHALRRAGADVDAQLATLVVGSMVWADDGSPVWDSVDGYMAERMAPVLWHAIVAASQAANPMPTEGDSPNG